MPRKDRVKAERRRCCACGKDKVKGSYHIGQWRCLNGTGTCIVCDKYGARWQTLAKDRANRKARQARQNKARQTYCHRWNGKVLLKTCGRYSDTCGADCYKEDEDNNPICFIEPSPDPVGGNDCPAIDIMSGKFGFNTI